MHVRSTERSRLLSVATAGVLALAVPGAGLAQSTTPAEIPTGGTIVWMLPAVISSAMPYNYPEANNQRVGALVNVGLTAVDTEGNIVPKLAVRIPTTADGDVSQDLLTVTWRLREGLHWSDGTPLTSDDLRFTWEVCGVVANGCRQSAGLTDIASVETPDDLTIILHYAQPYYDYATQFQWGILPRHSADVGDPAENARWTYNTTVNPNLGPFSIQEFVPNDHLTLVRNPNYYLAAEGKPYLDSVVIPLRPDSETIRRALLTGETDLVANISGGQAEIDEVANAGLQIIGGMSAYQNQLLINQWDPSDPTRTTPHPVLGDARVRQAIILASNPQEWMGLKNSSYYTWQEMPYRFTIWGAQYTCDIEPPAFDVEQAKALLDDAGWVVGPDGIREKDGVRATVRVGAIAGWNETEAVVWASQLKAIGIDATLDAIDNLLVYAGFAAGSPLYTGNFDLMISDYGRDQGSAQADIVLMYASDQVPSPENAIGINFTGVKDAQVDEWVQATTTETDFDTRAALYCDIERRVNQELWTERWTGFGPGYAGASAKLHNVEKNELFTVFGYGSDEWYLEP